MDLANGSRSAVIHSFALPTGPGRPMITVPHNLVYLPILQSQINSIRIWLTNQNQRPISNREETFVVVLDVREVKEKRLEKAFVKASKSSENFFKKNLYIKI